MTEIKKAESKWFSSCCCSEDNTIDTSMKEKEPIQEVIPKKKGSRKSTPINEEKADTTSTPINEQPTERKRKRISEKDRIRVWKNIFPNTFEAICLLCKKNKMLLENGYTWHVAHIQSFKEGGEDDLINFRPICTSCNLSMGKKHFKVFIQEKYPDRTDELMKTFSLDG